MKIAITGHTKGIGSALYTHFGKQFEVYGFSKSNGFDISKKSSRDRIKESIKDFDIFVNNAYNNFDNSQLELLNEVFELWKGLDKTIVNISSRYTNENSPYCLTKKQQDIFCEQQIYHKPRIINIKPGLIDTDRVKSIKGEKMELAHIVYIIEFCLNNHVHSITFGK